MPAGTFSIKTATYLTSRLFSGKFLQFVQEEGFPVAVEWNLQTNVGGTTDETVYVIPKGKLFVLMSYENAQCDAGADGTGVLFYDGDVMTYAAANVKVRIFFANPTELPFVSTQLLAVPVVFQGNVYGYFSNAVAANKNILATFRGYLVDSEDFDKWIHRQESKGY